MDMIKAGMEKRIIKRTGQKGNYRYFVNGKPIDLTQTETIVKLIQSGAFETPTLQAARYCAGGSEPVTGPRRGGEAIAGRFRKGARV